MGRNTNYCKVNIVDAIFCVPLEQTYMMDRVGTYYTILAHPLPLEMRSFLLPILSPPSSFADTADTFATLAADSA